MIRFIAVRLAGGSGHEHVSHLWWVDPATSKTGDNSRAELVAWIEEKDGKAYVEDEAGHRADVGVRTPVHGPKYLQTYADGIWKNNLLSLPRK